MVSLIPPLLEAGSTCFYNGLDIEKNSQQIYCFGTHADQPTELHQIRTAWWVIMNPFSPFFNTHALRGTTLAKLPCENLQVTQWWYSAQLWLNGHIACLTSEGSWGTHHHWRKEIGTS